MFHSLLGNAYLPLMCIVVLVVVSGLFDRFLMGIKRLSVHTWFLGLTVLPFTLIGTTVLGVTRWLLAGAVVSFGIYCLIRLNNLDRGP